MKLFIPLTIATVVACCLSAPSPSRAEGEDCPFHSEHRHRAEVDARGDAVMGFEHTRTVHRFVLSETGGVIRAEVRDAADVESLEKIRGHLGDVARAFTAGDFSMPREIHGRVPPGVSTMIDRRAEIEYRYEELPLGAQVVIGTGTPETLAAVHSFLRFQIEDHGTGDPLTVVDQPVGGRHGGPAS